MRLLPMVAVIVIGAVFFGVWGVTKVQEAKVRREMNIELAECLRNHTCVDITLETYAQAAEGCKQLTPLISECK